MATTPKNRITRTIAQKSVFEDSINVISSAVSINQGDLVCFDDTANLLKSITADADAAGLFLGIARVTIVSGLMKSPYSGTAVDASQAIESIPGPVAGVIARMKLKSGDAFAPGDAVYGTAVDAQTVSSAGTNKIGIYQGASVTAGAGSEGEILLITNFRSLSF